MWRKEKGGKRKEKASPNGFSFLFPLSSFLAIMPFSTLKGEKSFNRTRSGKPGRGKLVSIRWNPLRPNAFNPVRVGIVVSKKVGKAVVRNKVRRRIKEILRKMHLPPSESVIVAQPEAATATYWELLRDLSNAMKKSGLVQ